jgi:hypothetical protein
MDLYTHLLRRGGYEDWSAIQNLEEDWDEVGQESAVLQALTVILDVISYIDRLRSLGSKICA